MRKVLLPIDGSYCARETVKWAINTLDKGTTQYYLLYVINMMPGILTDEFEVEDALKSLQEVEALLKTEGCTVEKTEYMAGEAKQAICKYADEMNVDQVLIGSHGRSGIEKLLLGSVSTYVLEHCKKPVFIYRNLQRKAEPLTMSPSKMI